MLCQDREYDILLSNLNPTTLGDFLIIRGINDLGAVNSHLLPPHVEDDLVVMGIVYRTRDMVPVEVYLAVAR